MERNNFGLNELLGWPLIEQVCCGLRQVALLEEVDKFACAKFLQKLGLSNRKVPVPKFLGCPGGVRQLKNAVGARDGK